MSDLDQQLYREVILDHYKNPRGHGALEPADAHAEGQNPLCGDEVSIFVRFGGPVDVQSLLQNAARLKRLSRWMRMIALLPDSKGRQPRSPWGGVCLFEKVRESPS